MEQFKGISVSPGITIGNAYVIYKQKTVAIPKIQIQDSEKSAGWNRFTSSLNEIISLLQIKTDSTNKQQKEITETYLMMLQDQVFIGEIKSVYEKSSTNIERVVLDYTLEYAEKLRSSGIDYLSERASDVIDVYTRVIHNMLGLAQTDFTRIPQGSVIISENIQPSEAIEIFKQKISAFVLNEGGKNSHLAILARSYGIPTLIGVKTGSLVPLIHPNIETKLIVDGNTGDFFINPDNATLKIYADKIEAEQNRKALLSKYVGKKAVSKDGEKFHILANIGSLEEVEGVIKNGADGIGLLRTEFLFMQEDDRNEFLSEDAQFKIYSEILSKMQGKPVVIRTLDSGGDKIIHAAGQDPEKEANPLLGNRAVRFCLSHPEIFKTQLRALYRASVFGNLQILFPLLTTREQFKQILQIVDEVKAELTEKKIDFKDDVPLGIMIETPSAAICADQFAPLCQFFSIGTNDLTQYTMAVDRENNSVADLFDEFQPSVIRLIKYTYNCAKNAGIRISVCGEFASVPNGIKILSGIGIRTLSMTSTKICSSKELLEGLSISDAANYVNENYGF